MTMIRWLGRTLARVEGWFLVLFLGVMVALAFTQVVLRNAFGSGLLWGDTLVRQMVMWAGFTGAAIAASQDRHISVDAITKFISKRTRQSIRVVTNLFAAVVCSFLARAAWTLLLSEQEHGGEIFLRIPQWVGLLIIPAGYVLLTIHFLLNFLESGLQALGRDEKGGGA